MKRKHNLFSKNRYKKSVFFKKDTDDTNNKQSVLNKEVSNNKKINSTKSVNSFFNKYSTVAFSMLLVVVFVVVLSASYAFFTTTVKGKEFVIYTGTLAVNYAKKTDVINVENLYPMTNTQGLEQTAHEFTVTNDGNINARYQVRLELDNSLKDMISTEYIKLAYSIDGSNYSEPVLLSDLDSSLAFIRNMRLAPTEANTIGIKLWVDIDAPNEIQGKTFKAKVVVDSIQDVEDGYVVDTVPIIYLNKDDNGNQDINLKVGQTYKELGVNRVDDDSDVIKTSQVTKTYEYYDGENLSTVGSVDTNKKGIYYITYSVTDSNNNTGKVVRIVTVNNIDTIPSISLIGESVITLEETEEYIEQGVNTDNSNKVITIGEVKTNTVGTYILRYIVIDENENLNSVIRTVNINKATTLYDKIFAHNTLIEVEPTLTDSSNNTTDPSGLYKSTETNSGNPTYYFRGNVTNNYVEFASFTWRIVRVNEDGTIRIVMQDGINDNSTYAFNSNYNNKDYMYYTNNSNAKTQLETWYTEKISSNQIYANRVATDEYYCEQAKIAYDSTFATNSGADMVVYSDYKEPNFKCKTDKNNKGLVNASIGLLNYDEVLHAGGYFGKSNSNYYLYNSSINWWTMSLAGFSGSYANAWYVTSTGFLRHSAVYPSIPLRAVLNLKADTVVIGSGTKESPYKIVY